MEAQQMTSSDAFVKKVVVSSTENRTETLSNPTIPQMLDLIARLDTGDVVRLDLYDDPETTSMTVFASQVACHFTISVEESTNYYYLNEKEMPEQKRETAGHYFDASQVCEDRELAKQIIMAFAREGVRFPKVRWEEELLGE
jgi:hypothetical protein